MTLFLLGYAVGLKDKIKAVMRTLLTGVSMFIFYITASGSTQAQLVYLKDTSTPPVLNYLNKFLDLQPKRSLSPAYSPGNKAFFEGFRNQIEDLPAEDHLLSVEYTIEQLEKMSTQKVKDIYNLDKNIALAILKGIYEMAEKEPLELGNYSTKSTSKSTSSSRSSSQRTDNTLYDLETKQYQGETYYIYSLKEGFSIKQADFHTINGSFYHCMYQQCEKIAFASSKNVISAHVSFANGAKSEIIDLQSISTSSTKVTYDEIESTKKDVLESNKNKTTEEVVTEDDLLSELSDLFGDIL